MNELSPPRAPVQTTGQESGLVGPDGQALSRDVAAQDRFFTGVESEMSNRGFVLTSLEDAVNWARTGSLCWMTF
ncbi:MAG: hypothetical protein ACK4TG_11015, partial [Thermaurantiacus sp.]